MAITFNCAQCGKSYTLDDSLAGKQAKCSCGTEMTVPAPSAVPAAPVAAAPVAAAPSPFAAPAPGQLPPGQPMPGQPMPGMMAPVGFAGGGGKSDKQKIVAALLCWFLGALGVHRFYLGHTGIGIIQMFTLGGCGIWQVIDFIMILTGSVKDAQGRELS